MNETVNETMGAIIARKRKELGLTQEQLGDALGVSYQAVSKWENELSSPDISALPLLADTLGMSIDALFGRGTEAPLAALVPAAPAPAPGVELPWPDDETLHAVLFAGHTLVGHESAGDRIFSKRQLTFTYEGPALNVQSDFALTVEGDVAGSVTAGGDVSCDTVGGAVTAGGSVNCDEVEGGVQAGGGVNCDSVEGDVQAGGDVNCDSVGGSVTAGGDVSCDTVGGGVRAQGDVQCETVGGSVEAGGDVSCDVVGGRADGSTDGEPKGRKKGFSFEWKL